MISEGYSEYHPSNHSFKDIIHMLNNMTVRDKQVIDGPKMTFGNDICQPI